RTPRAVRGRNRFKRLALPLSLAQADLHPLLKGIVTAARHSNYRRFLRLRCERLPDEDADQHRKKPPAHVRDRFAYWIIVSFFSQYDSFYVSLSLQRTFRRWRSFSTSA